MTVVRVSCHSGGILIGSRNGNEAELCLGYGRLRCWGTAWRPFLIDKAVFCLTSFHCLQAKTLPIFFPLFSHTPPHRDWSQSNQVDHTRSTPCQTVTPPRAPPTPNRRPQPGAQGRDLRLARARRAAAASNGSKSPPPPTVTTPGATAGARGTTMTRAAPRQGPATATTTAATPETATATDHATAGMQIETGTAIATETETAMHVVVAAHHAATGTTDPGIETGTGTPGRLGARRRTSPRQRPPPRRRPWVARR